MARVTAEQYRDKWSQRLKGSTEFIKAGADRVSEAPGVAAARKHEKMLTNLTEAITSGRWEKAVSAVTVDEWRKMLKEKGVQRIASGVDGAAASQMAMAQKLLAAVDEIAAKVKMMPDNNIEDSIQRMGTFARGMHGKRGTIRAKG